MSRIKECLDRMGKTQKWLAVTMGVKQPSVHDWITGENKPTADNLKRLSEIFHVSTDYLLGVPEEEAPQSNDFEGLTEALAIRERLRRDPSYRLLFDAADKASPFFDDFAGDILQTAKGGPMTETAFSRAWESYIRQLSINAGHPVNIRPHDLRHTYCTMIADAGVSIKQAMQWMGHADEKMILHIYDHVTATRIQTSTEKLNSALLNMQTDMQMP